MTKTRGQRSDQALPFFGGRGWDTHLRIWRLQIRLSAEGAYVARTEFAPPEVNGGQRVSGFARSELEESVTCPTFKCGPDASGDRGIEIGRARLRRQSQMTVWSQNQSERSRFHTGALPG
jgi:hypothetical protein